MRMPRLALPPLAVAHLLSTGENLGVWRITGAVADPGFAHAGQWFSARHAIAADTLAEVMVLKRNARTADVMLRFADQADGLSMLDHPVIAVPTDSGVTLLGLPYLIVPGTHGRPVLQQLDKLDLRARVALLINLCEALRYCHQQGWLLAELDPAMLWLTPDGGVRLMALGLARMPDPMDPFDRGLSLGAAPAFVAPECRAGAPPSLSSEVYGLGALGALLLGPTPVAPAAPDCADDSGFARSGPPSGFQQSQPPAQPQVPHAPHVPHVPFGPVVNVDDWPGLTTPARHSLEVLLLQATAELPQQRQSGAEAIADALRKWLTMLPPAPAAPAEPAAAAESQAATAAEAAADAAPRSWLPWRKR